MPELIFFFKMLLFQSVNIHGIEIKHQNRAHTDEALRKRNETQSQTSGNIRV